MAQPGCGFSDRFRSNLLRCRRLAGLSQERLARLASVHRTEIGMLENGQRLPRIDTLVKLAASLEVSPSDLLDGIEWLPDHRHQRGTFRTDRPARRSGRSSDG